MLNNGQARNENVRKISFEEDEKKNSILGKVTKNYSGHK